MRTDLKNALTKNLVRVDYSAKLDEAYSLMKNNWIRHLPVMNSWDEIVGILSDRDLMRAADSHLENTNQNTNQTSGDLSSEKPRFDPNCIVGDYMSAPVKSFDVATPTKKVLDRMLEDKVSAFLITDNNEMIGIVTTEDMLRLLSHLLEDKQRRWPARLENFLSHPVFQKTSQLLSDMGI